MLNFEATNLILQRNLSRTNNQLAVTLQRLSTGVRINSAADDAANLAISTRFDTKISGTQVAHENTLQAKNFLDTADSTLGNMTEIAQRIRNLTLQSMNGTYSDDEKLMMQQEVQQLTEELYRQKNSAQYGNLSVLGLAETVPLDNSGIKMTNEQLAEVEKNKIAKLENKIGADMSTVGTYAVAKLSEDEAIAQGYTIIKTADELANIPNNSAGKYILMNDIDLSGVAWTAKNFNGEFNGNGYAINNLTMYSDSTTYCYLGLFNNNNGTIENLSLNNVDIKAVNGSYVSGLCSFNKGIIKNCSVSGSIEGGSLVGGLVANGGGGTIENSSANCTVIAHTQRAGGLVGGFVSKISNCTSSGKVQSATLAGGLIGTNSGTITNSFSDADVVSTSSTAGGLSGENWENSIIENSTAKGNISGGGNIGGLAGSTVEGAQIINSLACGNIISTGSATGGLVGKNLGQIESSMATGSVSGKDAVGGLVGNNFEYETATTPAKIINSSATGNVTGTSSRIGGLVGTNYGTIDKCYATGNVKGDTNSVGGLAGHSQNIITNSYSTGDVNGNSVVGGFIGEGAAAINNSYATGNVSGTTSSTGAFIGSSYYVTDSNCFSSGIVTSGSGGEFYGEKDSTAKFSDCYANCEQPAGVSTTQTGVTNKTSEWFTHAGNLDFLGDEFYYCGSSPELISNPELHPEEFAQFQIGANAGKDNQLNVFVSFTLNNFYGDVTTTDKAKQTLDDVDALLNRISAKRAEIGATSNILDNILESQNVRIENMSASNSTIKDTDVAAESAKLVKAQILRDTQSALLSTTARTNAGMALKLLGL